MNQDPTSTSKSRSGSSHGATAGSDAETLKSQLGDSYERAKVGGVQGKDAASDILSDPLNKQRADVSSLKDTIARLIAQAGGDTAATMRNVGQSVASQVGSAASGAAEAGSDLAASAKEQAKTFAAELEGMARRNPLGALAGALLVGVVIGMMSRGRG
jgi:ElaB/YqjD/DUF883 family membrane-anchored ribosome-binding protein